MNSKMRRDTSKDPLPNARNTHRAVDAEDNLHGVGQSGGNIPLPAGAEKHGQRKGEHVSVASRYTTVGSQPGPEQPRRNENGRELHGHRPQTGGNVPATHAREDHMQPKAKRVTASQRGF